MRPSSYPRRVAANDRELLRKTFGEAAELYDRARPGYPPELLEDLAQLAGLAPGARVLEIGCGTGQATMPLAERGYAIVAVELSAALAAVARRKLARFPAVEIVVSAFEDWPLPVELFDVVVSATAFHWIDPEVRMDKAADALRPGGKLAVVETHHVAGGDAAFFTDAQACYERWDPATPAGFRLPQADEVPATSEELEGSPRFEAGVSRRYEWEQRYSTAEYLELLLTYSGHRALEAGARRGLLDCISGLIDSRDGGSVAKRYLTVLRIARRGRA